MSTHRRAPWAFAMVVVLTMAAVGPGISVGEARREKVKGQVLVDGYLVVADGRAPRLCTGLSRSQPPRCVRPALEVQRLAARERRELTTASAGKVRWSVERVQILGRVHEGVLRVSSTAKA